MGKVILFPSKEMPVCDALESIVRVTHTVRYLGSQDSIDRRADEASIELLFRLESSYKLPSLVWSKRPVMLSLMLDGGLKKLCRVRTLTESEGAILLTAHPYMVYTWSEDESKKLKSLLFESPMENRVLGELTLVDA